MKSFQTPKTKVNRLPSRGKYDEETIYQILDSEFICHVAFQMNGQPYIIPTAYGRKKNLIYLHGSVKSRMLQHLSTGASAAISVTQLNGLVLARSTFNSSMNYRSVVVLTNGKELSTDDEKMEALRVITNQILPGRWEEARLPDEGELKATSVLAFPINEASAKIRTGPPEDKANDYHLDVWAGVLPLETRYGNPIHDPKLKEGIHVSSSITNAIDKQDSQNENPGQ